MYINSPALSSGEIDGETFFELEDIDGKPYVCTYDQVQVNENGSLTFLGRMDRFYINNDGVRFDAGLVETLCSGSLRLHLRHNNTLLSVTSFLSGTSS